MRPAASGETRFDALPLGPAVLEPDLHLDLGELQGVRDLRPLRQGQVLLGMELLLELEQLLAREGGASTTSLLAAARASLALGS